MNDFRKDDTLYQTGSVHQKQHHRALVAMLLVAIVLLSGIITLLSLLNIRLFVALKKQENSALHLQSNAPETASTQTSSSLLPNQIIDLNPGIGAVIPSEGMSSQQIYANCIDSVVTISCNDTAGTGLVVAEEGYIVTNHHLIRHAENIQVQLSDGRRYPASLVGSDSMSDLAVLRIEAEELSAATFGNSDSLQVGDTVCAIGDPMGSLNQGTITNGTISAIDGSQIHTDAMSNSTGPLLDRFGQVVGIHISPNPEQPVFAVSSAMVKRIVEQLICQGYVSGRPGLGVSCQPLPEQYQYFYNLPAGLYITEVLTESAGIPLEVGDILLTLEGHALTTMEELEQVLYQFGVGDICDFEILRDGIRMRINVTLNEAQ